MLDVVSKRCAEIDCDVIPSFNFSHEKKPIFCFTHKTDGMLDISSRRCIEIGCVIRHCFNNKGEKKPLYCKLHKKENMINITSKKCSFLDCDVTPAFNFSHEKKPIFCVKHKNIDMVDLMSARCIQPECNKNPYFNLEGEKKALYCSTHKKDNMIDIKNKNCIHNCCKLRPKYNYEGEVRGIYCTSHKLDGMVNVLNIRCLTPLCTTQPHIKKYDGYCMRCFMYTFPDKPVARNYKTKEFSVVDYITKEFPEYVWITDKIIQDGCSKKRPDLLLDLGYQVIIVEIDENQHKTYECSCDNKRLMELSQDVGHRPIVFIRFNPDEYISKEGQKVKSCWSTNGYGINIVSPKCKNDWETRLENLKEQIEYWTTPENKTDKTVEVVQLYYDEKI